MAWRSPLSTRRLLAVLACLSIAYLLYQHILPTILTRHYDIWPWTPCPGSSPFNSQCPSPLAAVARDTLIIVKTGGSEPLSRLRAQLDTLLAEVPESNLLILSDLEEEVDGHRVHDVYADVSPQERALYPELALYDLQREYVRTGRDTRELKGGWEMAKYMDLAMQRTIQHLQQTATHQPTFPKKWYITIDTDTYITWPNLFHLLSHLNPSEKIYLGSPVWLRGFQFAHGGSAYVLSHGALAALNKSSTPEHTGIMYSQFGLDVTALCCGDLALATVLKGKGVRLRGYWPMFNGEVPATLSFGDGLWCEPVVSLHHVSPEEMRRLAAWVQGWRERTGDRRPLLFKDLYTYISPHIPTQLENWENTHPMTQISPTNNRAHTSFATCQQACETDAKCLQFVFDGRACALSHHIRLGLGRAPAEDDDDTRRYNYTSGWMVERIREWTETRECEDAHWLRSNP